MTLTERTLLAIHDDWTDLRDVARRFPAHVIGTMAVNLEQMEREGLIEVRQAWNPCRLQVRKAVKA